MTTTLIINDRDWCGSYPSQFCPTGANNDGKPLRWVEHFDGSLVLLRLGLLGIIFFAIRSKSSRSYRNKWFELALLAHLVPRVADAQSAYFTVTSGPCTVDPSATNCIMSPNFPLKYGKY